MTKVGILGGAFNPPTIGHIKLAEAVLNNTDLEEVWLTPCYDHLFGKNMVAPEGRLDMCAIASRENKNIHVFDYEIRHKMGGSTHESLKKLLDDPQLDVEVSLIIGQDNANLFHRWKNADKLREMVSFVVVGRPGVEVDPKIDWYAKKPHTYVSPDGIPKCSSTEVREHIAKNGRQHPLPILDEKVREYIEKHQLYRVDSEDIYSYIPHSFDVWIEDLEEKGVDEDQILNIMATKKGKDVIPTLYQILTAEKTNET